MNRIIYAHGLSGSENLYIQNLLERNFVNYDQVYC